MMKRMNLTKIICAILLTVCCNACKDDDKYIPISLAYAESGTSPIENGNAMTISMFSDGESFYIQGGNGIYTITNQNTDKINYEYNGNVLTILPKATGEASLFIADRVGNSYTLYVKVAYPIMTCSVKVVAPEVIGDNLTQKEVRELNSKILGSSLVKEGGTYVFTYTYATMDKGIVSVYPSEADPVLYGTFKQDKALANENDANIRIEFPDESVYHYVLADYTPEGASGITPSPALKQDVTNVYKDGYPNLEAAYCIQIIEKNIK